MVAQPYRPTAGATLADGAYRRWLGAHLIRVQGTAIELLLPYRDEFGDAHGYIQRAIVAGLADVAGDSVRQLRHESDTTHTLRLRFVGAAHSGSALHAHAWLANDRVHVDIRTNGDRTLIARATRTPTVPADVVVHRPSQPRYPV